MNTTTLLNARKNIYSQNGEDGVIELLMNLFDIKDGTFCEFGAWDGKLYSNTFNLLENKNWKGVYIEGDLQKYQDLLKLKDTFKDKIQTINAFVGCDAPNNLDNLLKPTFLDKDFDLLSIDIDGMDYHVWDSVLEYTPKFVIIEVNSRLKPDNWSIAKKHNDNVALNDGTSFSAMCELGIRKGYYPIIHFGNVFFARQDILKTKKFTFPENINNLFTWLYGG